MDEAFPGPAYIICGDARTGTGLLATTLKETWVAGQPFEYFGLAEIDKPWMREELHVPASEPFVSIPAWRDYILRAGSERGGVFGAAVHWSHVETLRETFQRANEDLPLVEVLRRFFPQLRLIRLWRRNLVAQAVSHHVAIENKLWTSLSAPERKSGEFDLGVRYDFDAIDALLNLSRERAQGWARTLADASDITLELTYEDLAADLEGSVRRALAHIGVGTQGVAIRPVLRKQAGEWSLELERRYRAERQARGMGPVGDGDQ